MLTALTVGVIALPGCGGASATHHSRPAPALDGCVALRAPNRALMLHPAGGAPIQAVLVGSGETVFVLTDQSDQNLCSWLPFVRTLTAHGYSALLYDYFDATELRAEVAAGARAALGAGARHVVLMGASVGARASIQAAAAEHPGAIAVVSLSAEQSVSSDPADLATAARRVRMSTLLISGRDDPYVAGFTPQLLSHLGSRDKHALILPGADHGTALLTDSHGPAVQAAILEFVAGR